MASINSGFQASLTAAQAIGVVAASGLTLAALTSIGVGVELLKARRTAKLKLQLANSTAEGGEEG
jgi:adenine/guanine phosphoribosyltransferase-like PRPP-binding protein